MEAARPPSRRGRARRRAVDGPVDTRLVRVALLVVVFAAVALLLSVSVAGTLPGPTVDPLFDADAAAATAAQLSTAYPARIPGTAEAGHAASWYEQTVSALGLTSEADVWRDVIPGLGEVEMRNVVTVVRGRSDAAIVVVAHRDNAGAGQPLGDNASGTAALLELARGFGRRAGAPPPVPQRTLVLVSTDGGAYGGVGALRFAERSEHVPDAIAAIVLDGVGGSGRPRIALAAGATASPARVLVATAVARVAEQTGAPPELPSLPEQLVDLALPFGGGEQAPFLDRGIAAVALTTREPGEPRVPVGDPDGQPDPTRLQELGRATEALVESIDASVRGGFGTPDALFAGDRVVSGWTVRLLLVIAVAPFALGVLDLLARARRRRFPVAPALGALAVRLVFWTYGGFLLWLGSVTETLPTGAPVPFPPYSEALTGWPVGGVLVLVGALGLGWVVAHRRIAPGEPVSSDERLSGYAVALAWLALLAILIAVTRPYALVFVLPSLYAWLWMPLQRGGTARVGLYALGLTGPALGLLVLAAELELGPVDTLRYVLGLASIGYLSIGSIALAIAWLAAAAQLGALAFGRYAPAVARMGSRDYASSR